MRSLTLPAAELVSIPPGPWATDLEAARQSLAAELTACLAHLAGANYTAARRQLVAQPRTEDEYLALSDAEQDALSHAARVVHDYEANLDLANDEWLTVHALAALAAGETGPQIAARWQSQPWAVRAEILARFSWVQEQRNGVTKGWRFSEPYRCTVTQRNVDREARTVDREHYQLINYLHGLAMITGERRVWSSKGETPDFILTDEAGCAVGAEMGEAPLSTQWADEEDARTEVEGALEPWLVSQGCDLLVFENVAWRLWRDSIGDFQIALARALAAASAANQGSAQVTDEALSLSGELKLAATPGRVWVHATQDAADVAGAAQDMADAICRTVNKKLVNQKTGKPRKLPVVRPCDLVLYPNGGGWPDAQEVVRLAKTQLPAGWNGYFDRIWMSSERFFDQLG